MASGRGPRPAPVRRDTAARGKRATPKRARSSGGAPRIGGRREAGRAGPADVEIRRSREGDVVRLFLGPAGRSPRLGPRAHASLCEAAREIDHDDSVRAVVVESLGRDFCAGDGPGAPGPGREPDGVAAIAALRVPTLALLHGAVLDEGLELALACDLRVCASDAELGLGQVARGVLPHRGGTQRLPRLVGRARALRMLLLGDRTSAAQALAARLVEQVVPRRRLRAAGTALAFRIAERGPVAQRLAKEAAAAALDLPLAEGLRLEGDLYVLLQTTADRAEGIASFRERRRPSFSGT